MKPLHLPVLLLLAGLTGGAIAQELVVPAGFAGRDAGISSFVWSNGPIRSQSIYDNSTFTDGGVVGPITIQRLRFRAAASYPNLGGQVFAGVTVRLGATPTTSAVVLSNATSANPTTSATVIETQGLLAGQFASGATDATRCFQLTFTSGANAGITRVIAANTATTITVSAAFPSVPAAGDAFDVVRLPITYDNMASDFAANLDPAVGAVQTFAAIPVAPAFGSTPNTYVIDLALGSGAFTYDPTTMGNLVVEVTVPTAPAPNGIETCLFACSRQASFHKAKRVFTTTGAAFGALTEFVPIMLVDFAGVGGSPSAATNYQVTSIGAGCGGESSNIQQVFGTEDFDLRGPNSSIRFTPDNVAAPTNYTVTRGTAAVDLSKAVGTPSLADDAVVAHVLAANGWSAPFAFPGGTTTQLSASTNGFVWLANLLLSDFQGSTTNWIGGFNNNLPARFAPCWYDWHAGNNLPLYPASGLYVATDTTGGTGNAATYVTWREVGQHFGGLTGVGGSVSTFQCAFFEATGVVEFRYGAMALHGGDFLSPAPIITGFTRGTLGSSVNSNDAGSHALSSSLPYVTGTNGTRDDLALDVSGAPQVGGTSRFFAHGIPTSTQFGVYAYDFAPSIPGISIPGLTANGCIISLGLSQDLTFVNFDMPGGATQSLSAPVGPYPASFVGYVFYAQYACTDLVNPYLTSNGLRLRIGYP